MKIGWCRLPAAMRGFCSSRKHWCRAGLIPDQGWRTCLSLWSSVLDWHCLQSGWPVLGTEADLLDSRSWKWSVACSSAQALSRRGDLKYCTSLSPVSLSCIRHCLTLHSATWSEYESAQVAQLANFLLLLSLKKQ